MTFTLVYIGSAILALFLISCFIAILHNSFIKFVTLFFIFLCSVLLIFFMYNNTLGRAKPLFGVPVPLEKIWNKSMETTYILHAIELDHGKFIYLLITPEGSTVPILVVIEWNTEFLKKLDSIRKEIESGGQGDGIRFSMKIENGKRSYRIHRFRTELQPKPR